MGMWLDPQQWGKGAIQPFPIPMPRPVQLKGYFIFPQTPQILFKRNPKAAVLLLEGNIFIGARALKHNRRLQDLPFCAI